jgi:KilA-N domain
MCPWGILSRPSAALSLTDMWRAAGGPKNKKPYEWERLPATTEFAEYVESVTGKSRNELFQALTGGPRQGTWAHWQIGLAPTLG